MKDKLFNPASTNSSSPAPGMAAVNTFNSEELDTAGEKVNHRSGEPKNFDREEDIDKDNNQEPTEDLSKED